MARSLEIPEEIKAKLESPRAKVFTTLGRVFDSTVGREYLHVDKDADHGLRGTTTKEEFLKGFTKLVSDVALGKESSRTLNSNEDIKGYFNKWKPEERPSKKRGTFIPSDLVKGKSVASLAKGAGSGSPKKSKSEIKTVLPRDLQVRNGTDRLVDIRRELTKLKRD